MQSFVADKQGVFYRSTISKNLFVSFSMYDIIPPSAVIGARSRKAACHPRRHRDGRVRADCRHGRRWV